MVRMAGMTSAVVPANPAACPDLPRQASIERRIAEYLRFSALGYYYRWQRRSASSGGLRQDPGI
jgi:hypothetical protein